MFRAGMACAALIFTAGLVAILQQNLLGAGLILAPPLIMGVVTSLLPGEASRIEREPETDEPQRAPVIDRTATRPTRR
jgi:hypothetical protein